MTNKTYDATDTINDFDGGAFIQKVTHVLKDCARAVANQDSERPKKGKVTITLDLEKIADSRQLRIDHDVAYKMPTKRGQKSENNKTSTPMYVNSEGALTLFPDSQVDMFNQSKKENA